MSSRARPAPAARAGPVPALVPGVCQVWWARTDDARPAHDALLGQPDLERRSRVRRVADRQRLTVGAALSRVLLGVAAGVPPAELRIDRTCPRCGEQHGKPWLPALPDVHFSVSHSAGCVAVAVLRGGSVGIDVEEIGPFDAAELEGLAACALAPEERAELARQPAHDRARAFTTYWTRKEALVKATGEGLAASLDRIVVSPPSSPPRLLHWDGPPGPVSVRTLHPPAGLVGSLAILGEGPTGVVEHVAGPVLQAFAGS
jgi:4'-phosphopantetheinyl transferase